ncbi:MAG: hypothetical protein E6Q61_05435 [Nitrosomonas sp.]|nr:MAG: hypothetical protein E6Q61_05435 [Nitrosomonas sp.]
MTALKLDSKLLQLTPTDFFSIRDSFEGILCLGQTGSGKTSGFGKTISGAVLRAIFGGLVLVAKPDEVDTWKQWAKEHGRQHDLLIFDETQGINFMEYEFARRGVEAANSVTDTILKLLDTANLATGQGGGKEGEKFWKDATRQCLLYSTACLYAAQGKVTIADIIKFVTTVPTSKPATEAEEHAFAQRFAVQLFKRFCVNPTYPPAPDMREAVTSYFVHQWATLADKTRSSIVISLTATLNRFTTGLLRKCFCDQTTILPELTLAKKIIVVGIPVLTYQEDGVIANVLWKLLFQRMVDSRNGLAPQFRETPLFLYGDEMHYFTSTASDDLFLSTCRSSRCAVIAMSQSVPTFYAQMGKDKSDSVDGYLGKFGTKVFCLQADPRTNKYAADLIGKGLKSRKSSSVASSKGINTNRGGTQNSAHNGFSNSESTNETIGTQEYEAYLIEPNFFASNQLKTGSARHQFEVSGVWFKAGANFTQPIPETNRNCILATFLQKGTL